MAKFGAWKGVMQQRRFHPALSERFESRVQGGECHSATSPMPPLNDGKEEPLFMELRDLEDVKNFMGLPNINLLVLMDHGSSRRDNVVSFTPRSRTS